MFKLGKKYHSFSVGPDKLMTQTMDLILDSRPEFLKLKFRYTIAMKNHFVICIMSLLIVSCVSVKFPSGKVTSAKDVELKAPGLPFKEIAIPNSDKAWLSEKTGNTISYQSECGGNGELSLQQLETDSLSALTNLEIKKEEELLFNGRAARQSLSEGLVDGVPVQLALLVFKKNGCNFTLSYGGTKKNFDNEKHFFENFKNDFKAP
ncbi:MAG: hypothetical protein ACXVCN_14280 [Bdellovibrio sp.]